MKQLKHCITICLFLLIATACSNNPEELLAAEEFDASESFENQIMSITNNDFTDTELITAYSEVMTEVLQMSNDQDFRSLVYEQTKEANSWDEDYVMHISDMTKKLQTSSKFGKSSAKIASIVSKIESLSPDEKPMVFFPKAETLENNAKTNKNYNAAKNLNEPIAVLKGAYNDDYSAPGYTLNSSGKLVFNRMVTEEDAYNNDVYVIGKAETVSLQSSTYLKCDGDGPMMKSSDCYSGGGGGTTPSSTARIDGRAEYGGIFKATDLNAIEHWFSGKLELRVIVAGVSGSSVTVIKDLYYGRVTRSDFKSEKWKDFNTLLYYWNTSNIGNFTIEKWIEKDGGKSVETSISTSFKPEGSSTSITATVKVPSEDKDDDLGTTIVQFTDPLSTEYPQTFSEFKRK